MSEFVRTEETATEAQLRELFDMEPDEEMQIAIPVCAGEWRREGDIWRVYLNPEWSE